MSKVKDKGIKAFFRILWGTNEPEQKEETDEIQEELQKSIDRINKMAQKYGTFEVSHKTPRIKKAVVKAQEENKQEQKTRNAKNKGYGEERE